MSDAPHIVFVKFARFSNSNASIERCLRASFPEFELHTIDVATFLKTTPFTTALGALETILRGGPALLDGRRSPRAALLHGFVRSPILRRRVGAFLQRTLAQSYPRARFVLIAQTLFGSDTGAVPFFVYTDSAALANLYAETFALDDLPPPAWLAAEKRFLLNAARIFTWSDNVSRAIADLYHAPRARIVRILAGCNMENLPTSPSPAPADNKTILLAGVEWDMKGGPWLVEAFRRLPDRHRDAKLRIVGCAPRLDLQNCTVVGRVPLAEMTDQYTAAAIFCMPTKIEAFGIAFIEAMSHSLATIAPRMGAMPDYIEHGVTGLLHTPGDVDDIARQLTWLLDHPEQRRAIATNGFAAVQEYRWDKVGSRMRAAVETYFAERGERLV